MSLYLSCRLPQIHEEEAREALLGFVAEHCCYGKGAARDLKFTDLRHSSAFHVSTKYLCLPVMLAIFVTSVVCNIIGVQ